MSVIFDFSCLETGFEALWPIKVMVPQDGGKHAVQTFVARLRHVSIEELQAARDKLETVETAGLDYKSIPALYFVGLGPDEKATWSPELRDKMLSVRWVREALERGYSEFVAGDPPAKN
jgi:hypothetical protein